MPFQPPPEYKGMTYEQFKNNPNNRNKHPSIVDAEWKAHVFRKTGQGQDVYDAARQHSQQYGMSEDYLRFDPAAVASWGPPDPNAPDPRRPYQAFDGSGWVEKPIDSNYSPNDPRSIHRLNTTGGAARGGGGGQAPATGPQAAQSGLYNPMDPLQRRLLEMASTGGGFFGQDQDTGAAAFGDGGVWTWGGAPQPSPGGTPPPNPLAPRGSSPPQANPFAGNAAPNPFQQAAINTQGSGGINPFAPQQPQTPAQPEPQAPFGQPLPQNIPQYKQDTFEQANRPNKLNQRLYQYFGQDR